MRIGPGRFAEVPNFSRNVIWWGAVGIVCTLTKSLCPPGAYVRDSRGDKWQLLFILLGQCWRNAESRIVVVGQEKVYVTSRCRTQRGRPCPCPRFAQNRRLFDDRRWLIPSDGRGKVETFGGGVGVNLAVLCREKVDKAAALIGCQFDLRILQLPVREDGRRRFALSVRIDQVRVREVRHRAQLSWHRGHRRTCQILWRGRKY